MKDRKSRILAELPAHLLTKPRPWVLVSVVVASLTGMVAATAVAPQSGTTVIRTERVVEILPAPTAQASASADAELPFVYSERIHSGDTLQSIFLRLRADDAEALAFIANSAQGKQAVRQMRAGRWVTALVGADGRVASFTLPSGNGQNSITVERNTDGGLQWRDAAATQVTMAEMRSGVIQQSLFAATDAAGVPDSVARQMTEIFGTEIDFHSDLHKGDRFNVVYEVIYEEGNPVGAGRVLAAEFTNQGTRHAVVLYRGPSGTEQYYSDDGRSLRQGFLRSPLEFSRVSSSFGQRVHPLLNDVRDHKGTDFSAPSGTPVRATSDGVIDLAGSQRGYGNIVVINHRNRISTAYAHLSGFAKGVGKGTLVNQGDVIGYVGSTGWATGPHLHYEVRINEVAQDPMQVALPMADTLDAGELAAFKRDTATLRNRFALLNYADASTR